MRAWALAMLLAAAPAAAGPLGDALVQGDLICEFHEGWKRSLLADLVGEPAPAGKIVVYERITPESAQAIAWHAPGRRDVLVRATGRAVHFIERVGPSVRVTSLTGCERTRWRDGEEFCVRFTAQHAWHFDAAALLDPDGSLERQPSGASTGACETWRLD